MQSRIMMTKRMILLSMIILNDIQVMTRDHITPPNTLFQLCIVLVLPKTFEDWHHTSIFHTYAKCNGYNYKIIIDGEAALM